MLIHIEIVFTYAYKDDTGSLAPEIGIPGTTTLLEFFPVCGRCVSR